MPVVESSYCRLERVGRIIKNYCKDITREEGEEEGERIKRAKRKEVSNTREFERQKGGKL